MPNHHNAAARPAGHGNGVRVATNCWSCETSLYKTVPWRHRHHRHFTWSCAGCAVDWSGPGFVVAD